MSNTWKTMNNLKIKNQVRLRSRSVKSILKNISVYTTNGNLDLRYAEEIMVLLGAHLKKFPVLGQVHSYGARNEKGTNYVGVNLKSDLGQTGVIYYDEKDLERVYNKRKKR